MESRIFRILVVEDNEVEAHLLAEIIRDTGQQFDVAHAETMIGAQRRLSAEAFDAVLLDLSLPDSRGLDTLQRVQAAAPGLAVVVLTGLDDEATGTEAIRRGAQDYLVKGNADGRLLVRAIRYAVERKRAEEEIRTLNAELEKRVIERTAVARQRAAQLRVLASQLTLTEQRERRRLAQILHDHLQQLLVATRLKLGMLARRIQDPPLQELVQQMDGLLEDSIQASRSLTVELSPPVLYDAGLGPALQWLARHMSEKHGLAVDVVVDPQVGPMNEDTGVLLFSAVRELLFNVVKHAGTASALVQLCSSNEREVRIVVSDQGTGFDPAKAGESESHEGGFGLFSIRERLELLGGRFLVESTPGSGTRIELCAPRQGQHK